MGTGRFAGARLAAFLAGDFIGAAFAFGFGALALDLVFGLGVAFAFDLACAFGLAFVFALAFGLAFAFAFGAGRAVRRVLLALRAAFFGNVFVFSCLRTALTRDLAFLTGAFFAFFLAINRSPFLWFDLRRDISG